MRTNITVRAVAIFFVFSTAVLTTAAAAGSSLEALCAGTEYEDACKRVLGSVGSDSNTTTIITTAAKAALHEITAAFDQSGDIAKAVTDPNNKLAIEGCIELLDYAIDELKAVIYEAINLGTRSLDLRGWLSAVLTYQSTCLDELSMAPDLKAKMENIGLTNGTQMTMAALKIVTELAKIASGLPEALKGATDEGRILGEYGYAAATDEGGILGEDGDPADTAEGRMLGEDGYPTWMSAADRKLMASGNNAGARPDVVVAQDGSGDYNTISQAVDAIPPKNAKRYTIYVKAGVYKETVTVKAQNVFMYGDGTSKTILTFDKHNPVPTSKTATLTVLGMGFICKRMGFKNTAGPAGGQAVAVRVQADRSAFFNCHMDAYQDTLYTHAHFQFYSRCLISGTVDFIFGRATVILQNCRLVLRRPLKGQVNIVTADGREMPEEPTGIIIHSCSIEAEESLMPDRLTIKSYLGRPWRKAARTVVMESKIGDVIAPEGWLTWQGANNHETCYYAEYKNEGDGAVTDERAPWAKRSIERSEAMKYTVGPFLQADSWLAHSGARFIEGLKS